CDLSMHVWVLGGILAVWGRTFYDLDFKLHRELFRRIAGGVVTRLVSQLAMNHVSGGQHASQRTHFDLHREFSGINVQLVFGGKSETHFLAGWITDSANHNVSGRVQLECGA